MIFMLVDMLSILWWCHVFDVCHEYMLNCMLWMLGWGSLILARLYVYLINFKNLR